LAFEEWPQPGQVLISRFFGNWPNAVKRCDTRNNRFAFIDVPFPLLCTGEVRRVLRAVWVLAANGCVAWLMFTRLVSVGFQADMWVPQLLFEFVFEVILPIIGIVLELANWKFARWVNVGCFAVAGLFWLAGAVWWRSDPFFGVLLIIALIMLTTAGITEVVYRRTTADLPYVPNS
jgi:hypothetical protein